MDPLAAVLLGLAAADVALAGGLLLAVWLARRRQPGEAPRLAGQLAGLFAFVVVASIFLYGGLWLLLRG
jgi:hypothetical protein